MMAVRYMVRDQGLAVAARLSMLIRYSLRSLFGPLCLLVSDLPRDQLADLHLRAVHHIDVLRSTPRLDKVVAGVDGLDLLQDVRDLSSLEGLLPMKITGE